MRSPMTAELIFGVAFVSVDDPKEKKCLCSKKEQSITRVVTALEESMRRAEWHA